MDLKKLKVAMLKHDVDYKTIAKEMGITYQALLACLTRNDGSSLKIDRARVIAEIIGLTDEEIIEIFFEKKLGD